MEALEGVRMQKMCFTTVLHGTEYEERTGKAEACSKKLRAWGEVLKSLNNDLNSTGEPRNRTKSIKGLLGRNGTGQWLHNGFVNMHCSGSVIPQLIKKSLIDIILWGGGRVCHVTNNILSFGKILHICKQIFEQQPRKMPSRLTARSLEQSS